MSSLKFALLLSGKIGVRLQGSNSVLEDISKRWVDVSSLASEVSIVGGGTVNKLLLGESGENIGLQISRSLDNSNSSESPTRSTRCLVWGSINGSGSGPVNGGIKSNKIDGLVNFILVGILDVLIDSQKGFNELLISEVHELVLSELVGAHWVIVYELDLLQVFPEN